MKNSLKKLGLLATLSVFLCSCESGVENIQGIQSLFNPNKHGSMVSSAQTAAVYTVSGQDDSITDQLYSVPIKPFKQLDFRDEFDAKSCDADSTATITIFSTNGDAYPEIDVTLDGHPIGSLTTYYPDGNPGCQTPTAQGVISVVIPSGKHKPEAASSNIIWPDHNFSVETCQCMLIPLT